ncbi:MAG: DNA-processing protein DprA [Solirubrobacteraceae bacterium]
MTGACGQCLARTWLLARLAGHIDQHRDRIDELLALEDGDLIAALAGKARAAVECERDRFDPATARANATAAAVEQVCRCDERYPASLRQLESPPAVLHIVGDLERLEDPCVAIVGARRPSPYGIEVAGSLARGAAIAGVAVISGMASGIDTAAHRGAVNGGGTTFAVLAGAPERPYPSRARGLHARIKAAGAVVSELPPGTSPRRWMFPARNRLIAALSAMTVVVEARPRSGALVTARHARRLDRIVGAVPGRVTSPLARGTHQLLRDGAQLIEGPEQILDALFGPGQRRLAAPAPLDPQTDALLGALAEGHATATAVKRAGMRADQALASLASLELAGRIERQPGGRYAVRRW